MSSSAFSSTPGKPWEPPTPEELQPELPQYEILGLLGRGGMGAVYRARQKSLKREVAIKVLPPTIEDGGMQFADRFKAEAEVMARLNHPGVVAVYDAGETPGGLLYIVMEFVEGTDVAQMIRSSGKLPPEYAYSIAAHVCDALAYAHENGLIHRDIKPANIMVDTQGRVKVADFGLAKMTNESSGLTQTNMAVGTPDFVAPEALIPGMPLDGRADLYAVGVMLYQMLTGSVPRGAFKPASVIVPGVDARFDQIVLKAMQMDREERYSSAVELRQSLDTLLIPAEQPMPSMTEQTPAIGELSHPDMTGAQTAVVPQSRPTVGPRPSYAPPPKSKTPVFLGLVAVAAVVVGAFVIFNGKKPEEKAGSDTASQANPAAPKPPLPVPEPVTTAVPIATKDAPFVNSLGMKFVPVKGTNVWFCIHETRYRDYATYAAAATGVDDKWKDQNCDGFMVTDRPQDHPVMNVSWEDSQNFCAWLSQKEGRTYRLPTDEEWSVAVGLEGVEIRTPDTMPALLSQNEKSEFPWVGAFPPTTENKVGNYSDASRKAKAPFANAQYLDDYDDGFPTTAPVMSFKPNKFGLYDMGGNIWEWCEDWWDGEHRERVLRGASWRMYARGMMLSSGRSHAIPGNHGPDHGVRCVMVPESAAKPATTADEEPKKSAAKTPEPPMPMPAPVVPQPAVTKPVSPISNLPPELAALDSQFMQLQAERVTGPFEAGVAQLNTGYLGGITRKIAEEKAAGHLDVILALEAEQKLLSAKQPVPDTDDDKTPEALKALRAIYREAYAKLTAARVENLTALTGPLDKRLKQLEVDFTKADRLPDAKTVRGYREVLADSGGAAGPPAGGVSPQAALGGPSALPTGAPVNPTAALALKDGFTNSLGMKFVEIPGTDILMCVHETRFGDYAAYAAEVPNLDSSWLDNRPSSATGSDADRLPVNFVNWDDAVAFCVWLGRKEGFSYRLPSDAEWSIAVGISREERPSRNLSPDKLNGRVKDIYPWGEQWPPPSNVGNYSDSSRRLANPGVQYIQGYSDRHPELAPVMSYPPNKLGLHDLGGNVWEWCEDWRDEAQTMHLARGASFGDFVPGILLSSNRGYTNPPGRAVNFGFRIVVEKKTP